MRRNIIIHHRVMKELLQIKNREARARGLSYGAYIAGVSNVRNEQSTKRFISGGMNKSKKQALNACFFSKSLVLERDLYEVDFCN